MKQLLITTIAIFGLALISNAQVPNYIPTNGLVGYWPFNGNANDESGNNINGNVVGPVLTSDRNGSISSAYSFDGQNDYIFMGSIPTLSTSNNNGFTIALWFNSNTYSILNTDLYDIRSTNTSSNQIYINNCGNGCIQNQNFDFPNWLSSGGTNGGFSFFGSNNFTINNWVFVVYSQNYSTNENKLYVNGVLSNDTISQHINLFNPDLNIGSRYSPYVGSPIRGAYFSGILDDIGIWNRSLNQQEITDLYNASNCANNTTITPQTNTLTTAGTAIFSATTSDSNPSYIWQSDLGQGFQTLNNYGNYSGTNTNSLSISNVQLPNHTQPIRVISTSGECIDTSNVATIYITDTCILTINETITTLISVTDTLVINTLITGLTTPNNLNTIKVFPNPANSHLTIDFGNFALMNGYNLKITNSIGQIVFTTPITEQSSYIDLSTWGGNGIYFVQIIDTQNNTIENRKIVLQ